MWKGMAKEIHNISLISVILQGTVLRVLLFSIQNKEYSNAGDGGLLETAVLFDFFRGIFQIFVVAGEQLGVQLQPGLRARQPLGRPALGGEPVQPGRLPPAQPRSRDAPGLPGSRCAGSPSRAPHPPAL